MTVGKDTPSARPPRLAKANTAKKTVKKLYIKIMKGNNNVKV